jgi:hypothetical protein
VSGRDRRGAGAAAAGLGGATLATAVSACCVPVLAPLVVSLLGVGGAVWIAGLQPWSGWILLGAGGVLGWGFAAVYRRSGATASCPARRQWLPRAVLWAAAALWLVAAALNLARWVGAR